ncbi:Lipopolysaccharide-induced tumor necrosis factor-alpha factor -like protein [Trichinella nativa]|uniref:Lipopolysaccharide-induced tumor necrosis factor-alpha factor-like protein n=1 Tax=Trichinella nativa TaxID=6335 RepID=A0A0V1KVH2_9BILA|nr:Lipopolysaccharide-induced tumor necrosis factor-alpha factor -like protein [Trichinella nativa]
MSGNKAPIPDCPPPAYSPDPVGPPPLHTIPTVIAVTAPLGAEPVTVQCVSCHAVVTTETKLVAGSLAWILCVTCLIFGFWFGCCLIPFCIPSVMDVEHRCPNCKAVIGVHRRI